VRKQFFWPASRKRIPAATSDGIRQFPAFVLNLAQNVGASAARTGRLGQPAQATGNGGILEKSAPNGATKSLSETRILPNVLVGEFSWPLPQFFRRRFRLTDWLQAPHHLRSGNQRVNSP
jgi:hypothetical protein